MRARYTVLEFKNKMLLLHCTGNRVTVMAQVQMPWAFSFILSSIMILDLPATQMFMDGKRSAVQATIT
jgi:hypothetical protein